MRTIFFVALLIIQGCQAESQTSAQQASTMVAEVEFTQLYPNVWMHTSYKVLPKWGRVLSNGLVYFVEGEAILIDTAWTDAQTEYIQNWALEEGSPITRAVFTHAHDDKMGGVQSLREKGIATYAHPLSNQYAPERALTPAEFDLTFDAAGVTTEIGNIEIMYAGAGHTTDNIVVAIPETRILFGGCLIRSGQSRTLGNTTDGDVAAWGPTVEKIQVKYGQYEIVIPSHGSPAGVELLQHTISIASEASNP